MPRSLGLALSGGVARSIVHVGVLKVFKAEGIPIDAIAGTSGGSIAAVLYAAGLPVTDMAALAGKLSWRELAHLSPKRLGFLSTAPIRQFIEKWIGNPSFEDLKIPCAVVATDMTTFAAHVFNSGPILPAVEASCAIPHLFSPVKIDGKIYLDGGVVNFLPVECLSSMGAEMTVGVSTIKDPPRGGEPRHLVELMAQFSGLVQYNNYMQSRERVDILIHPNMEKFPVFELHKAGLLLEEGEKAARSALPRIRALLDEGPQREN
ncbi:MAG: patatin-like phospholipase family protein [Candidatus Eisenbacteria bacterium]|uniref:Patatin-like phospholipase family protein n=1 Tax=Eiseniibacteriota bacterium TaxID=2212470 RepID=A0A948W4W9_UNCEI|nr:patatin-like phospholipase family protein [Candidatus Eisenbacteria bacterium]MBU1949769.1 patatin-like phospholipase family protein [Candidatus Eisenbacteria bacterium]MBU2689410.1 patatin-like phospholipase family protein [Candidatus Eisenbacteria bacterium]